MLFKDMTSAGDQTPPPAPRAPDREVVERMIAGDESAFRELLARYRSTVYATVYAALQDPDKAEAIVADTFDEARRTAIALASTLASVSGWLTHLASARVDGGVRKVPTQL